MEMDESPNMVNINDIIHVHLRPLAIVIQDIP